MDVTQRNIVPKRMICWDMGNVFLPHDGRRFIRGLAAHSPFSFTAISYIVYEAGLHRDFETGVIPTQYRFYAEVARRVGASDTLDYATFAALYRSIFDVHHEVGQVLAWIRPEIKNVIISNTDPLMYGLIRAHPLVKRHMPHPRDHFLSFKEGRRKPDPEFFLAPSRRHGLSLTHTILVDDNPENVAMFENIGGTGILWNAREHSVRELEFALEPYGVLKDY